MVWPGQNAKAVLMGEDRDLGAFWSRDENVNLETTQAGFEPRPISCNTLGRLFSEAQFPCL